MTLTWQNGRQLASSSDGSTVTNYTYGADGMRMTKKVGSSTTYYQYFNGLLVQEIKGTKILDYSYDANGQIYAVRYRTNANDEGTYYYYAHNTRGDIVGIYNADGSLHAKYSYDVWGNPLSVTDASNAAITSQTDIANLQSFRYRGYYYDSDSGFYYLQSRYYDPVTHRFLNADGLVSTGTGVLGFNMFAYCENNPVSMSDSSGSRPCEASSVNKEIQENRKESCLHQKKALIETRNNELKRLYNIEYNSYTHQGFASYTFTNYDKSLFLGHRFNELNSSFKMLTEKIVQLLYQEGMPQLTVEQKAQWYGEIMLHFYGSVAWDVNKSYGNNETLNKYLKWCESVELEYNNGSVDDIGHNKLSILINVNSRILGLNYYLY